MPFSSGTYTGLANSFNDAVSGTVIDPLDWNELFTDIESAINSSNKFVDITIFGAVGDGATNNYTALAAAYAVAVSTKRALYIPGAASTYRYGTTLAMTTPVSIVGDGMDMSILEYTGASIGISITPSVVPSTANDIPSHYMGHFTVRPSVAGAGTYGIKVITSGGTVYSQYLWDHLRLGQWGTNSFWLDDVGAQGSIIIGKISACQFGNGFIGSSIGDSLHITSCRWTGSNPVVISMNAGARKLVIDNCNAYNSGGLQFNGNGIDLMYNQIELPGVSYTGGVSGAVYFGPGTRINIIGNRIAKVAGGTAPGWAVVFDGTSANAWVDGNDIGTGSAGHITATGSTSNIRVGPHNAFDEAEVITLSGTTSTREIVPGGVGLITNAMLANVATGTLKGRGTAGTGVPEDVSIGGGLTIAAGPTLQRAALTGDVTASAGSNTTQLANNSVGDQILRDSSGLSVIGRSANSTGDPTDIVGTDGNVLRVSGTTLGFGTIVAAGIAANAVVTAAILDANVTYAKIANGTGLSVLGRSANSGGVNADIVGTDGQILRVSGTALGFGTIVAAGIASDAVTTVKILNSNVTLAKIANGTALSVLGVTGNAGAAYADMVAGSDKQVMRRSGTAVGFGAIDLTSASAATTGAWTSYSPVVTSSGGTVTTYTASGAYCQIDKVVHYRIAAAVNTGSPTGHLIVTLPVAPKAGLEMAAFAHNVSNAAMGSGRIRSDADGTAIGYSDYTGVCPAVGDTYAFTGSYEAA